MRIHCGVCRTTLKNDDMCFLDEWNTVVHQSCYSLEKNAPIKDLGTYRSLIEKYEFFSEDLLE